MQFSDVETLKPPAFALVRPDSFHARWDERPTGEVAIGLRPISPDDAKSARAQAAKIANAAHPNVDPDDPINWPLWVDSFNDQLMLWVVSHAMCDPNDASVPWKPFEAAPEDMARDFLTTGGVLFLYQRWERMRIESDPTAPEITADELTALPDLLAEKLPLCGRARATRVRRLLAFVVDELMTLEIPGAEPKV